MAWLAGYGDWTDILTDPFQKTQKQQARDPQEQQNQAGENGDSSPSAAVTEQAKPEPSVPAWKRAWLRQQELERKMAERDAQKRIQSQHSSAAAASTDVDLSKLPAWKRTMIENERKKCAVSTVPAAAAETPYERELRERREKAANRRKEEEERRIAAALERQREDRKLRGFNEGKGMLLKGSGEVSIEDLDADATSAGIKSNQGWKKSDHGGWGKQVSETEQYLSQPSKVTLPLWVYDELRLGFGLRRPTSSGSNIEQGAVGAAARDFVEASNALSELISVYLTPEACVGAGTLGVATIHRRMRADVEAAGARLLREYNVVLERIQQGEPVETMSVAVSVPAAKAFVNLLRVVVSNAALFVAPTVQGTVAPSLIAWSQEFGSVCDTLVQNIAACMDDVAASVNSRHTAKATSGDLSLLESLPREMLRSIVRYIASPRDLANLAQCNSRLNSVAQDDDLFYRLLHFHFEREKQQPKFVCPKDMLWRDLFIKYWTRKHNETEPAQGLRVCKHCGKFYWGSGNMRKVCRRRETPQSYRYFYGWGDGETVFKKHAGTAIAPMTLIDNIVRRKVKPTAANEN